MWWRWCWGPGALGGSADRAHGVAGVQVLTVACDACQKSIEGAKGKLVVKEAARAVSAQDDRLLMEKVGGEMVLWEGGGLGHCGGAGGLASAAAQPLRAVTDGCVFLLLLSCCPPVRVAALPPLPPQHDTAPTNNPALPRRWRPWRPPTARWTATWTAARRRRRAWATSTWMHPSWMCEGGGGGGPPGWLRRARAWPPGEAARARRGRGAGRTVWCGSSCASARCNGCSEQAAGGWGRGRVSRGAAAGGYPAAARCRVGPPVPLVAAAQPRCIIPRAVTAD